MANKATWEQLVRRTVYDTEHLKLYSDDIKLPDGSEIKDYSVVELSDGVVVVATDEENRLIAFDEYKYAANKVILNLPSGSIDSGESPIEAAKRELLEETGYGSEEAEYIAELQVYPSKIIHINHVVRIKNAHRVANTKFGNMESISEVQLIELKDLARLNKEGKFNATYLLAPLALTLKEYL